MTNHGGALMRTEEELDALLPGAVVADGDGDALLRVPGGWRYQDGGTLVMESHSIMRWGPVVLLDPGPLDAHLADPLGQDLVQAILDRKAASQ